METIWWNRNQRNLGLAGTELGGNLRAERVIFEGDNKLLMDSLSKGLTCPQWTLSSVFFFSYLRCYFQF